MAAKPSDGTVELDAAQARGFRQRLMGWYRRSHRRLPWRAALGQRADPYRVLVSEAMLQQTQVVTVIPYFERFIARFPTLTDLAAAQEQAVLRLWQGLGYYRRARNLHAAARLCVERFGGRVPDTVEELLKLPGVGRYTAGAVASIAFGRAEPILDGNVARVLARWFGIESPIDQPATRKRLWDLAAALVPARHPGDFNQAMMELGALVCLPRAPTCLLCPVASLCQAHRAGKSQQLPVTLPRKAPRAVTHTVAAIERDGTFLLEQRPADGLWSNLWQLPTAEQLDGQATPQALADWVAQRLGLRVRPQGSLRPFTHQTTHRTIRFVVWRMRVVDGRLRPGRGRWRKLNAIDDLPLSNPQRRIVALLNAGPA